MKQFIYHIAITREDTNLSDEDAELQKFGEHGWELVNVVFTGSTKLLYFKKLKEVD